MVSMVHASVQAQLQQEHQQKLAAASASAAAAAASSSILAGQSGGAAAPGHPELASSLPESQAQESIFTPPVLTSKEQIHTASGGTWFIGE